jgi:putative transposase
VLTDAAGAVEIEVPANRVGMGPERHVRPGDRASCGSAAGCDVDTCEVDTVVIGVASRGLTTGEISAHFAEVYGASVSKDTVTRIARLGAGWDGDMVVSTA